MTEAELWDAMLEGSQELAEELALGRKPFHPRSLAALDRWLDGRKGALDDEDVTRLALFLARVLVETHSGGLMQIRQKGHPLDRQWAVSGFSRGLANDYCVPVFVSATRIGVDRSLTATAWYQGLLAEGR